MSYLASGTQAVSRKAIARGARCTVFQGGGPLREQPRFSGSLAPLHRLAPSAGSVFASTARATSRARRRGLVLGREFPQAERRLHHSQSRDRPRRKPSRAQPGGDFAVLAELRRRSRRNRADPARQLRRDRQEDDLRRRRAERAFGDVPCPHHQSCRIFSALPIWSEAQRGLLERRLSTRRLHLPR